MFLLMHPFLKMSPAELVLASWLPLFSVHVSQPIVQASIVSGNEYILHPLPDPFAQLCATHYTILTKTI